MGAAKWADDLEVMMRNSHPAFLAVVMLLAVMLCLSCGGEKQPERAGTDSGEAAPAQPDSASLEMLFAHIMGHFDDIHDVTMRYHHKDHNINGRVAIHTEWEGGVLAASEVVTNETGDDGLPESIIEKLRAWKIEGLEGPLQVTVPFNVQIVGLDDPEFPNTAILTGEVAGEDGTPLSEALILIKPEVAGHVFRTRTNREGIFVSTLIPPGTWDVECSLLGYGTEASTGLDLGAGDHERLEFVLKKK